MAYCGMAAALCVALMLLGAVIPIAMFIAPALAGFLIATVCVECGRTMALTAYAAVSLLALLFVPAIALGVIGGWDNMANILTDNGVNVSAFLNTCVTDFACITLTRAKKRHPCTQEYNT